MKAASHPEQIHAIVPVNILTRSKFRLSSLLQPKERAGLTIAMLRDVLRALKQSAGFHAITVVSLDTEVRRTAELFGANFLWEKERRGLNQALRLAVANAQSNGATGVFLVHADLPLISAKEMERFLVESHGYQVVLVPSKDGKGTNAMLLKPPTVIPPAFGKSSFLRHLRLAEQAHVRFRVVHLSGLSFDVDEPDDLQLLMKEGAQNDTSRYVAEILAVPKGGSLKQSP